ncbi:MAG: hypothetical protein ACLVD1_11895 [Lacrimispora saccharolytica]
MKKIAEMIKRYKKIMLAVCLLVVIGAGATIAYLSAETGALTNTFEASNIDTDLEEDTAGVIGTKKPSVENVGTTDCLVRMRVNISPEDADEKIKLEGLDLINWSKDSAAGTGNSGWYYYQNVLEAGKDSKTTNLFEHVVIKDQSYIWDDESDEDDQRVWKDFLAVYPDFSITLYQESCPTSMTINGVTVSAVNQDGTFNPENAARIWAAYDAQTVKE